VDRAQAARETRAIDRVKTSEVDAFMRPTASDIGAPHRVPGVSGLMRYLIVLAAVMFSSPCFASLTLDCTADDKALAFDLQMTVGDTPARPLGAVQGGLLTLKRDDLAARFPPIPIEAGDIQRRRLTHGRIDLQIVRKLDAADAVALRIQTRDVNRQETDYVGAYEFQLIHRQAGRAAIVVKGAASCSLGP
jgi:hypothetical protein